MGMIVLAIVCGILANELFAWGPRLSDLLLKIASSGCRPSSGSACERNGKPTWMRSRARYRS